MRKQFQKQPPTCKKKGNLIQLTNIVIVQWVNQIYIESNLRPKLAILVSDMANNGSF